VKPRLELPVADVAAQAYRIPTDAPESDGTFAWDSTTLIVATVTAGNTTGLGYTYGALACRGVIFDVLAAAIRGQDSFDIPGLWSAMRQAVRNIGYAGVCACAISAVDSALWDLKSKYLGLPLTTLLGSARDGVAAYGSGGFTSYEPERLRDQLGDWIERNGCHAVKMKVGREPARDGDRIRQARSAIGEAELYVDANGALNRKQALAFARRCEEFGVTWFEEPVSSDDAEGLHLLRDSAPAEMDIAAGEYGYDTFYFLHLLQTSSVDVLQADASRCGGITGFLKAAALAEAFHIPLSCHTAPALHLPAACAAPGLKNIEWFHDHVRIEQELFDGAPELRGGMVRPDLTRPGLGLEFKTADAKRYAL
jgi:L-alanine-DL-glutamate epimerase-like enolase superfamily enzyme